MKTKIIVLVLAAFLVGGIGAAVLLNVFRSDSDDSSADKSVSASDSSVKSEDQSQDNKDSAVPDEPQNGSAIGKVYESDGTTAIENVKITPMSNGTALDGSVTETNEKGQFELFLPAGDYELELSKDGYISKKFKVTVKNGEVSRLGEGADEYIALEKEITEGERIANILADNESLWHSTARLQGITFEDMEKYNMTPPAETCWFEDIDLDGQKEFIVGPVGMSVGQAGLVMEYNIFKIDGDSVTKFTLPTGTPYASFDGYSSIMLGDTNFNKYRATNMGLYMYKDASGNYCYAMFPFTINDDSSYSINQVSDLKTFKTTLLFDYSTPYEEYRQFDINGDTVSIDEFISKLTEYTNSSYYCDVVTKQITIADKNGKITSDCYSKQTKEEKIKLLAESFDAYKIVETDTHPELFERMLEIVKDAKSKLG